MLDEIEQAKLRIMVKLITGLKMQVDQLESIIKELRLKSLEGGK